MIKLIKPYQEIESQVSCSPLQVIRLAGQILFRKKIRWKESKWPIKDRLKNINDK